MDHNRYRLYRAEDFILDEDFIKTARNKIAGTRAIEQLKIRLPEKTEEISLAFEILNNLKTTKTDLPDQKKEEVLRKIYQHTQTQIRLTIFKYAAAVFLFAGAGTAAWLILDQRPSIHNFAAASRSGSENTELILADGQRVEIDSKQAKIEYAANSASVSVNDTAIVEQTGNGLHQGYNQVSIPFGKRSYILLSDGTKVWLNSGSRLIYPPVFQGNKREVYVEGEACFEVSENKEKPFYVCTESFKVRVLGTRFVVQADAVTKENYTVLVEGKVTLSANSKLFAGTYELLPSQKATLSENLKEFNITAVRNMENYLAWTDGYLNFEQEDLVSLAKRISRYYNIEIEVNTSDRSSVFSGKLDLKDDPERILNGLAIIFKTRYEKQGNRFVFYD